MSKKINKINIFAFNNMLVFVLIEKKKAKKLFNELPEDAQENFITHTKALGRVKSRIKQMGKSEGSEHNWYFY